VKRFTKPIREDPAPPSKSIRLSDFAFELARARADQELRTLANLVTVAVINYCQNVPLPVQITKPKSWSINDPAEGTMEGGLSPREKVTAALRDKPSRPPKAAPKGGDVSA